MGDEFLEGFAAAHRVGAPAGRLVYGVRVSEGDDVSTLVSLGHAQDFVRAILTMERDWARPDPDGGGSQHDVVGNATHGPFVTVRVHHWSDDQGSVPDWNAEVTALRESIELLSIADYNEGPGLPILRASCPAGCLEDLVQIGISDLICEEPTNRPKA